MTSEGITEDRKCYMYRVVLRTDPTRDYVGVSIHPDRRWWEHEYEANKKGSPRRFCKALRKYGADAFDWKVIAIYRNEQIARDVERTAVLYLGMGYYNDTLWMKSGAGPIIFTPELRSKISANTKIAMARPEVKEKVSVASKLMWQDPEIRAYLTQLAFDRWQDPEMKELMTSRQKAACQDPELRAYMREAQLKAFAKPEVKAKMSASQSAKWERPGYRETAGEVIKEALARPEVKENMSTAQKARFQRDGISEETNKKRSDSLKATYQKKDQESFCKHSKLVRINLLPR